MSKCYQLLPILDCNPIFGNTIQISFDYNDLAHKLLQSSTKNRYNNEMVPLNIEKIPFKRKYSKRSLNNGMEALFYS